MTQTISKLACAVLTLSDTRTPESDFSGQTLCHLIQQAGYTIVEYQILPDQKSALAALLDQWCARSDIQAILITGSTGLSPRDIAPEVIEPRFSKALPGFGELFRMLSWEQIGSKAMASRATAGLIGQTLVFLMPGSTKAAALAMEKLILPELEHLVKLVAGAGH